MGTTKGTPRRTRRPSAKAAASSNANGGQAAAESEAQEPLPGLPGGPPVDQPSNQPINAVIVYRESTPQGPQVRVGVNGDVQITEILTLLEMAIKFTRRDLGLDESR